MLYLQKISFKLSSKPNNIIPLLLLIDLLFISISYLTSYILTNKIGLFYLNFNSCIKYNPLYSSNLDNWDFVKFKFTPEVYI